MTTLAELGHLYVRSLVSGECSTGKLRFADAASAREAVELSVLRADRDPWRRERAAYPCFDCGGFHCTSKERR